MFYKYRNDNEVSVLGLNDMGFVRLGCILPDNSYKVEVSSLLPWSSRKITYKGGKNGVLSFLATKLIMSNFLLKFGIHE